MSKDEYIQLLAAASKTRYSELLEYFLIAYDLPGLRDATTEQLHEYCREKGLIEK